MVDQLMHGSVSTEGAARRRDLGASGAPACWESTGFEYRRVEKDPLTELPGGFPQLSERFLIGVGTFPGHDQRTGCTTGLVRVGGAAVRVA